MEQRRGHLFDLGPDGLGFVTDARTTWAFRYPAIGSGLAPNIAAFLKLEGSPVFFSVEAHRITTIIRDAAAQQKASKSMTAAAGADY